MWEALNPGFSKGLNDFLQILSGGFSPAGRRCCGGNSLWKLQAGCPLGLLFRGIGRNGLHVTALTRL